jgi:hypothetical protein
MAELEYDTDVLDAYCAGVAPDGVKAPLCMVYLVSVQLSYPTEKRSNRMMI